MKGWLHQQAGHRNNMPNIHGIAVRVGNGAILSRVIWLLVLFLIFLVTVSMSQVGQIRHIHVCICMCICMVACLSMRVCMHASVASIKNLLIVHELVLETFFDRLFDGLFVCLSTRVCMYLYPSKTESNACMRACMQACIPVVNQLKFFVTQPMFLPACLSPYATWSVYYGAWRYLDQWLSGISTVTLHNTFYASLPMMVLCMYAFNCITCPAAV